ncbi:sensor histidine kinase [Flavihumibacter petaseus]|uniref:Putative two-component histidine kinase n=1 Tax=Flavihumibacter petaseus NBRC 106054 TaxID=1220578 RepID=A0A0E9N446_9BACT|nr:histidine kinase [Flavihumibacter petaseus]GAO44140.1 putative two-component histidine kinase [Flavihumibacter petaseus NBRC 106054]
MQQNQWYTSKTAVVFYHILTWTVTLFLPYIMRTYLEEQRDARFGPDSTRFERPRFDSDHGNRDYADKRTRHWRDRESRDSAIAPSGDIIQPPPDSGQRDWPQRDRHGRGGFEGKGKMDPGFFSNLAMGLNLLWIVLFYLNAYYLIPRLVYNRKIFSYILCQIAFFTLISLGVSLLLKTNLHEPFMRFPMPLLLNIFPFLFVQAGSLAYRLIVDKVRGEKDQKEKENEGLKTELSFLRSQISPHFIFNVLNNLVSLARKKSDLMEPSLLRLSGLMRYMLYESDEKKVLLTREVEYLRSYIELQSLRFGNDVNLQVDLQVPESPWYIEPMLLIPFVENAFKHSASYMNRPLIDVMLRVSDEGVLHFRVNNQYEPNVDLIGEERLDNRNEGRGDGRTDDRTSGIGLQNVRRRLNLLYGSDHTLLISDKDGVFSVSLKITLS